MKPPIEYRAPTKKPPAEHPECVTPQANRMPPEQLAIILATEILAHKRRLKAAQMRRYRARKKDGAVVSAERVTTRGD